jgi:integrase
LTRETAAWRKRRLSELTRADVARLLDVIIDRGAPTIANRVLSALQRMGVWAVERGFVDANPFAGIRPPTRETARERVLTDREIAAGWRAFTVDAGAIGDAAKVLLLTGARLREVAEMEWSEIDLPGRLWTLPAARAKNRTLLTSRYPTPP